MDLFPAYYVTATEVTVWRYYCRFGTPLEIVTDQGSQFMTTSELIVIRDTLRVRHHGTIPYSKEENTIVERANKKVNRHIRNILTNKDTNASTIGHKCCT